MLQWLKNYFPSEKMSNFALVWSYELAAVQEKSSKILFLFQVFFWCKKGVRGESVLGLNLSGIKGSRVSLHGTESLSGTNVFFESLKCQKTLLYPGSSEWSPRYWGSPNNSPAEAPHRMGFWWQYHQQYNNGDKPPIAHIASKCKAWIFCFSPWILLSAA